MKVSKNIFYLFILVLLITMTYIPVAQKVYALTNGCSDSSGAPIPCPSGGGNSGGSNKPGPKNRHTPVTTKPTTVPKMMAMPTAPAAVILIPAGGAGVSNPDSELPAIQNPAVGAELSNPSSELPAIQNPGQGSSSFNLPGLLGSIIAVLLILGGLFFGLFLPAIQKRTPNDGSNKMGAQPHMNEGADQFLKFEGNPSSQFDKASDQFLKFEGSASEQPPGSTIKPPSPNLGDKSGGDTL